MTTTRSPGADVDLKRGRESPQWTDVHDWVALSGVSPGAIALYVVLRMHVNRSRDDDMVKTSTLTLAVLMGMSRGDKIKGYLDELVDLGAVDVDRSGLHRRNTYTVHQLPPPGYTGKITLKAWYDEHRALIALKRADEKAKRDARRAKAKDKEQVSPVTPDRGEQADKPVTPDPGEHVTPDSGEPVTPISGREPKEVEPDEVEPPTPPSGSSAAGQEEEKTPSADQPQPATVEDDLAAELIAARPDWSPRALRDVLADNAVQERRWDLVAAAFRSAATDPKTKTPRRLLHDACPHWQRAAHQLGLLPDPSRATAPPAVAPAPRVAPVDDGRPVVGRTPAEEFAATSRRGRALVEAVLTGGSVR
ncbi:hypothetical protein [Micromonospora sp. CB01531]|uniref:hypothetical protein n=1 Tax=Micromonospora sp. CB01531 TaxID=1718947 RepID=UPI000939FF54|nr:hypothetical protein [Micromonospora sp. CB01531]OKI52868.1 hypothetical protein A6A27_08245 [Micromonospora sp. CB01531]